MGHLRPPPVTRALCPATEDIRTQARGCGPPDHNKVSASGPCLCSPGPPRCRSNQVCSLGSGVPSCCGGSADTLPSRRRRRCGRRGRCCCCSGTARSWHPPTPGRHSNPGCIAHSWDLDASQWDSPVTPSPPGLYALSLDRDQSRARTHLRGPLCRHSSARGTAAPGGKSWRRSVRSLERPDKGRARRAAAMWGRRSNPPHTWNSNTKL